MNFRLGFAQMAWWLAGHVASLRAVCHALTLSHAYTMPTFNVCAEAQLGQYKGPHPAPGGGRILQALRFGGAGK